MTSPRRALQRVLKGPVGGMLLCLLIAGFLGGVAAAHPGGNTDHATEQTSPSDEPSEAPEAPEQDQQSGTPDATGAAPAAAAHTAVDCQDVLAGVQGQLPAVHVATGLAHAINTVEANCEKNLQAPGLVNALTHLVRNWERHQAHEAAKAAGVHGNSGVHGKSGVHGNSGVHGKSGVHGNSGSHGNSGQHGPSSGDTASGS
jgi:hypothetical protein